MAELEAEATAPGVAARVDVDDRARTVVVALRGEVDITNADALMSELEPVLSRPDLPGIVFELTELDFMDSSGLAVLLRVAGTGKQISLRHPPAVVQDLLRVTGLADYLTEEP